MQRRRSPERDPAEITVGRRDEGGSRRTERRVQVGFGLALAFLGLIGALSLLSVKRMGEDANRTRHAERVISSLRLLLSTVTDAETAERGYSLTGDASYLEPYAAARASLATQVRDLRALTRDNAGQQLYLDRLEPLVAERLAIVQADIDRRAQMQAVIPQSDGRLDQGKQLHDNIRRQIAQMQATEERLLSERVEDARHAGVVTQTVIIGGGVLSLGFVVLALWVMTREFAVRRRTEAELREARDSLDARVRERTTKLEALNGALRESEELFSKAFRLSPDCLVIVRVADRVVIRANDALCQLWGSPPEEIIGKPTRDYTSWLSEEERLAFMQALQEKGEHLNYRTTLSLMNGRRVEFEISARIITFNGDLCILSVLRDITARRTAEEAAALIAAIVESSDEAIIGKSLDGLITSWNSGAERIFGYSAAEMVGAPVLRIIPPERHAEEAQIVAQISRGEHVRHFETIRVRKDGARVDISVTVSPIKDASGRVVGASKIARDISEKKRAEAALRLERERFADTAASSPGVLYSLRQRPDGTRYFPYASPGIESLFGLRPEELSEDGTPAFKLIAPADRPGMKAAADESVRALSAFHHQWRVLHPTKGEIWIEGHSVPRREPDGSTVWHGVMTDITERKRAEAALRETEARLNSTLAAGAIGTWTWDIANDRLRADEFTARAFSVDEAEAATGLPAADYLQAVLAEDRPGVSEGLDRAIKSCGSYDLEYRVRQKDGGLLWLQARGRVEGDAAGNAVSFHGAVMDITARKQAEAAVRESGEYFRFLNDLAEVTRPLADPVQIMTVMARMLGEQLHASRVAYADVEPDSEQFSILHDYTDDCVSTVGRYQLSLFGPLAVATLRRGQTLIIRNVETELSPGEGAEMFKAIGVHAIICCPLVKDGSLRAMMAVHQTTPRAWKPSEIAIVEDVVERCWATIERRTAEKILRQREALLRIAGRAARLGGWAVDLPEVRITWSDEVCEIHDMPDGTVPDLEQAMNFYAPQSRETIQRAFALCIEHGTHFDLELEVITALGRVIWVRAIGEAQRNAAGAITRVQGAFQEITERKQTEEEIRRLNAQLERRVIERTAELEEANTELRHSRAKIESLFESLPGLYVVLTPDFKIMSVSDAFLKATMTTREGILGRGLFEVFPDNPDDLTANGVSNLRASLERVLKNAVPDTMAIQKYDIRRPDGVFEEHYWSPINSPVFGADRQIEYIIHRVEDVTEFVRRKSQPTADSGELHSRMEQMEAEIFQSSQKVQAANAQLEAANKELEAFSYSVSHDLRAPLRAVDGFSRIVLEDYAPLLPPEGRRYLENIGVGAQQMGTLIDDLLTFSRLSRLPISKRSVSVGKLVQDTLEDLAGLRRDREVEIRLGDLPDCLGDPALLKQVWINLLSNALKYTRNRKPAVIEIGCTRQNDGHVYFVRDNGAGFDMRYADKLFGVFQRLHRAEDYEGTGVGLAIVQRVINRHGGRIWAEAAVDRGATFSFTLDEKNL